MNHNKHQTLILSTLLSSCALLFGCQSLPKQPHLDKSKMLSQKATSLYNQKNPVIHINNQNPDKLSQAIQSQSDNHPNLSGYYPIGTGANAFASRSILADNSTKTIDVQYYIWYDDEAGILMMMDLWRAAERGVIVRVLLDDMNSSPKLDEKLAIFATHPNISVRFANPFMHRKYKYFDFVQRPKRSNTRMHNKSMTFDRQISIIGGRNIGNEYLNNDKNNNFADLDVLLIGQVVDTINESFESYWQSAYAYDIETLVKAPKNLPTDDSISILNLEILARQNATDGQKALRTYRQAVSSSTIGEDLLNKKINFRWVDMSFLADDVEKLGGKATKDGYLVNKLRDEFGRPSKNLSIISSYFVPTKQGVRYLKTLANEGIEINILTNSFDATDVGAVHAGYGHWREDLLKAGVRIFELKSTATNDINDKNKFWRTKQLTTTSLHAKVIALDDQKVFIGSYNVDPRSANINTELGVLLNDGQLAKQIRQAFYASNQGTQSNILQQAYELKLINQKIHWQTIEDGKLVIHDKEPSISLPESIGIGILSLMPIDWLL